MKEIDPKTCSRAAAFELWVGAPMPMVTLFKTLDVSRVVRISRKRALKFNMLMCHLAGVAASGVEEFFSLPVGKKFLQYDSLAVCPIVANSQGGINSCAVPFSNDLKTFAKDYEKLTMQVFESCKDHDIETSMCIGTSALVDCEIDGASGMYNGVFNNPFLVWGKYRRRFCKTTLRISFQFHHAQMDGGHAARFLNRLQEAIDRLEI